MVVILRNGYCAVTIQTDKVSFWKSFAKGRYFFSWRTVKNLLNFIEMLMRYQTRYSIVKQVPLLAAS